MSRSAPREPRAESAFERRLARLVPPALALLLAVPMFSLSYLYDDFDFLGRAQTFHFKDLLPDPGTLYYRPVSREAYFGLLYAIDHAHAFWGHLGNVLLLLVAVGLVVSLARKLAGPNAGLLAGASFAALGAFPTLVGWVSCSQDVFAVTLILAALHLQIADRLPLALLATALALLSKETSLAILPALVLVRPILGYKPARLGVSLLSYGALVLVWGAIHPGIRLLLSRHFESSESMALITLSGADRWGSIWRSLATLANLPVVGRSTSWPSDLTGLSVLAAGLLALGIWFCFRPGSAAPQGERPSASRILACGALLSLPAVVLISVLVRRWQPYYIVLPSIGTSLLWGMGGARLSRVPAALLAVVFLAMGIWCRGTDLGPSIPTEQNMRPPSERLQRIQAGFRTLFPRMDGPTDVYVSTETPEFRDVPFHLIRFQVLRVWYGNHAIETMHPERRRPNPPGERLVWISPSLTVHAIDPRTLETRSSGGEVDSLGYAATLRAYAQGLAASGETDRGVRILLAMRESDPWYTAYDRRLAAALLLADGRRGEAAAILGETQSFDREDAVEAASELLSNPPRRDLDGAVLSAMGLSPEDPETSRAMMRWFAVNRYPDATIRFARRLLNLKPEDAEATAVIRTLQPGSRWEQVTVPVEHDTLW